MYGRLLRIPGREDPELYIANKAIPSIISYQMDLIEPIATIPYMFQEIPIRS